MIVEKVERPVVVSKDFASRKFRISSKGIVNVLNIIRKQMYANPIRIIVQEYANNARDAHVANKCKDRPIQITCPTELSPYLKIRDFGKGMSPEEIDEVFVAYGESTKTETDDQIGGFGVGAKSAFAYCDAFEVTTICEGIKYIYSAYIDSTEVGEMPLIDSYETDEESGTLISIPIELKDIPKIVSAISFVSEYWDLRPDVIGSVTYSNRKVYFSENNWSLCERTSYSDSYNEIIYCVEGIPYTFSLPADDERFTESMRTLAKCPFIVKLKTNEVTIASHREGLVANEKTLNRVRDILAEIDNDFRNHVMESITKCDNLKEMFELRRMYLRLKLDNMVKSFTWKSINISAYHLTVPEDLGHVCNVILTHRGYDADCGYNYKIKNKTDALKVEDGDSTPIFVIHLLPGEEIHKNQMLNALRDGTREIQSAQVVVLNVPLDDPRLDCIGLNHVEYANLKDYSKKLPRRRGNARRITVATYYKPENLTASSERTMWEICTEDINNVGHCVYVPLRSRESELGMSYVKTLISACGNVPVYGIPVKSIKEVEENPKFVRYDVFIKEYCSRAYNHLMSDMLREYTEQYADSMKPMANPKSHFREIAHLVKKTTGFSKLSEWGYMISAAQSISDDHKKMFNHYNKLCHFAEMEPIPTTDRILKVAMECVRRYPLLEMFNGANSTDIANRADHLVAAMSGYAESIDSSIRLSSEVSA